ncbi:MAG: hypothetical protein OZ929_17525 [Bryobacterales bacterium]|nr:hypothetical protein [Bryobacterales bacterium]
MSHGFPALFAIEFVQREPLANEQPGSYTHKRTDPAQMNEPDVSLRNAIPIGHDVERNSGGSDEAVHTPIRQFPDA